MLKHLNERLNITRAEKKVKSPAHRLLAHLREICDAQGLFELNADAIAQHLGLSRRTVYLTLDALQRQGLVEPVELRRGRGRHSLYRLKIKQKNKPHEIDEKTVKIKCAISKSKAHEIDEKTGKIKCVTYKNKNINKTQSKDSSRCLGECQSPRVGRGSEHYQGLEAAKVVLVVGARFYRQAMKQIRLGLEGWELPEPIRHALEGFIGLRIDGSSLDYARQLVSQIWALRREIEALARSGASPRRVCAFVGGRLSKPDRAKLLRRFAAERLQRERHCRSCGGSLRWGQVEGCCWSCWESRLKAPQLPRKA